jgi:hypothetical protein
VREQNVAGTKHPIYARIAARQFYLSRVDLPPIFGPVISNNPFFRESIKVSLDMKFFPRDTQGCLISLTSK